LKQKKLKYEVIPRDVTKWPHSSFLLLKIGNIRFVGNFFLHVCTNFG